MTTYAAINRQATAELVDALEAAAAYVELFTPNGTRQQPPAWAVQANGDFNAEAIARRARAALNARADIDRAAAHPNFNADDFTYLWAKGWSAAEIVARWDQESGPCRWDNAQGKLAAVTGTKA